MASTQSRHMRPPGSFVSEKGNQLAPMPESFSIAPASGDKYTARNVLGLPRPIQPNHISNPPLAHSIIMGSPLAPENLSQGGRLTVVDYKFLAQKNTAKPPRRPKHQIKSNKSTFISRGLVFDSFTRRMNPQDPLECLVLTNYDRSLALIDYSSEQSCLDPLAKVFFTKAWPLCHALNSATTHAQQIDVLVGMSSGDLVWMDLANQRYERVNKMGNCTHAAVTAVQWVPNSQNLAFAAHADGNLVVYNVHGEDSSEPLDLAGNEPSGPVPNGSNGASGAAAPGNAAGYVRLSIYRSSESASVRAVYKLSSPTQHITALQFVSPTKLVVAAHNDYLKLFDLESETVSEVWPSLFGSVLALAVSPDGRYLCSGGEDDLISVFDLHAFELVARLSGHKAWVKSIAFDPFGCDEFTYRLASVGEDQQLIVWDLTPTTLVEPKWHPNVQIAPDLQYTAMNHYYNDDKASSLVVRERKLQYAASTQFFAGKAKPHFEEYIESPLTDVCFSRHLLLVASSDGRTWCWSKENSQSTIKRSLNHE